MAKPTRIQSKNRGIILAAALDVFSASGFRGATLDQIAKGAGLSKPNVLYYFKTKEDIFVSLLNGLMERWLEPLRKLDADGDPITELREYVRAKVEMSRQMPRESRLFANEILQGAPRIGTHLQSDLKELFDEKCAVLEGWMDAGKIARMDPPHLLFSIWATTQHYADFGPQIDLLAPGDDNLASAAAFLDTLYLKVLRP